MQFILCSIYLHPVDENTEAKVLVGCNFMVDLRSTYWLKILIQTKSSIANQDYCFNFVGCENCFEK